MNCGNWLFLHDSQGLSIPYGVWSSKYQAWEKWVCGDDHSQQEKPPVTHTLF